MSFPYWPNELPGAQQISSFTNLYADTLSTGVAYIHDCETSTLNAVTIQLDNAVLTANNTELLLNGIPIATTSNVSSIADWSLYPAVSTINANNNNITGFLTARGSLLSTNQANVSSVQANYVASPNGYFDNLTIRNLTTQTIFNVSTIVNSTFVSSVLVEADSGNFSSISTGFLSIAGQPYVSGSNWSQYNATSDVNMGGNGFKIYSGSNAGAGASNDLFLEGARYIQETAQGYSNYVSGGSDIATNSFIRMVAEDGNRGEISLTANAGFYNGVRGEINLTANGGLSVLDVGTGGVINITANTYSGFPPAIATTPSQLNMTAAVVTSWAGYASPSGLPSLPGYNYLYGTAGVNIVSGVVPGLFPNFPGTIYLYGQTGIELATDTYANNIYPYTDGTSANDLIIQGRTLPTAKVQLKDVRSLDFVSGSGSITQLSSINGAPISNFIQTSTFQQLATSSLAVSSITGLRDVSGTFIAVNGLSSINGISIAEYQNVSSISSLNEWAQYPALSTISFYNGTPAVIQPFNPALETLSLNSAYLNVSGNMRLGTQVEINGNSSGYVAFFKQGAAPLTQDVLVKDVLLKPDNTTTPVPFYYFSTANRLAWTDQTTLSPSIVEVANVRDLVSTFSTQAVVASSISCATLLGANPNIYGNILSTPGLVIDTPNLFLSTPYVALAGQFNGSTCSFTAGNIRDVVASTINSSTINCNTLSTNIFTTQAFQASSLNVANLLTTSSLNTNTISTTQLTASIINLYQSNVYGLSSMLYLSTANIPGQGTSTTLYANTDLSLGQNDLYAQQVRIGYNSIGGSALSEVIFYAPDGTNRALGLGSQDATIRVQSTANSGLNNGYLLDTFVNKPFFSTINNSTCMMATIPSTTLGVFGVSTLSVVPPINSFGSFYSSTSKQVAGANIATPLDYNSEAVNVGGLTFAGSTITIAIPGTYSITHNIQFATASGGTNLVQFWGLKNGAAMAQTNSIVSIVNNGNTLGTIELMDTAAAGDKYGVAIYSADTNMVALAVPAAGAVPAIPAVITNVKRLG